MCDGVKTEDIQGANDRGSLVSGKLIMESAWGYPSRMKLTVYKTRKKKGYLEAASNWSNFRSMAGLMVWRHAGHSDHILLII